MTKFLIWSFSTCREKFQNFFNVTETKFRHDFPEASGSVQWNLPLSLSAIPSPNPIGHGAALKQPCTNYWVLNDSSLITLTYQYLRQVSIALHRWLSWLREGAGREERQPGREETYSGCRSPPDALQEIYTWDNTQCIDTDAYCWYCTLSMLQHIKAAI